MEWVKLVKAEENDNLVSEMIKKLSNNLTDWDIEEEIDSETFLLRVYGETIDDKDDFVQISIQYHLGGYQPALKGSYSYSASTPEEYYGYGAYYEDFWLEDIIIDKINDIPVNKRIGADNKFAKALENVLREDYTTNLD